jgi:acetyl esterase
MPLSPHVQALLAAATAQGAPPAHTLPIAAARAAPMLGHDPGVPPDAVAAVTERSFDGPEGALRARIYTPAGRGPFPTLLHIHGGGWVLCSLDTHDRECRALAALTPCVVVAVDYRLAPEHPFPAAVDDCLWALRWTIAHAAELGGDGRVAIAGDSAGGNLATTVARLARDEGLPPLAGQLLFYPVTDYHEPGTPSYAEFAEGYGLTREEMAWFWAQYARGPEVAANPLAAPLRAPDLTGLPPALVVTAECDVLRDEGEHYARRMRDAGVPTTLRRHPGMIHGFVNMSAVLASGRQALLESAAWLRETFGAQAPG